MSSDLIESERSERIRVLYFVDRFLRGGIQTLLWNIANQIDRDSFYVEFLTLDDGNDYPMASDLEASGFKVHKLKGIWLRQPGDYVAYQKALGGFFSHAPRYDVIHMHSSSKNYPVLKAAEKAGVPVRIAHSHNTEFQTKNPMKRFIGDLMNHGIERYSTYHFACGVDAGKWMFGPSFPAGSNERVLRNAVDLSKYAYNKEKRDLVRQSLGIDAANGYVLLCVGRFSLQKNHKRLVRIFSKVLEKAPRAVLLLVGTGELEQEVRILSSELGVSGHVRFLGFRSDVPDVMCAADCLVMPSFHEGLPFVAIEAQATGLPCVFSEGVTREASVIPENKFVSLEQSDRKWADCIIRLCDTYVRTDTKERMRDAGYDIEYEVDRLESFYRDVLTRLEQ